MHILKWLIVATCLFLSVCKIALASALDSWPTWSVAQPFISKQVPPGAMIMRGKGTDAYYVLEVDPATGEIPVSLGGGGISIDFSGPTGSPVPSDAGYFGGIGPTGNLTGVSVDATGKLNTIVTSSALPTGAATETSLAGVHTDTTAIAASLPGSLGQKTMANSTSVAIASNQSAIPISNLPAAVSLDHGAVDASTQRVTEGSRSFSDAYRYDYTGGSVTTSAWTQIAASTLIAMNYVCITDQSGQIMKLGTGAAASETIVFMIPRGFSGCIPLRIAAATRLSLEAVSATASTGDFVISGMN